MSRCKCPPRKRHRLTIERATEAQNASGQVVKTWSTLKTIAANVVPLSGLEAVTGLQTEARVSHRVYINYDPDLTTKDRFDFEGRTLEIISALDVDERRREMVCLVTEVK